MVCCRERLGEPRSNLTGIGVSVVLILLCLIGIPGQRLTLRTTMGRLKTSRDGTFQSGPIWPRDLLGVYVTVPGYEPLDSARVRGESGKTLEIPDLKLKPAGADQPAGQ